MELYELSAIELGREVISGNVTPTEVIKHYEDRISRRNPSLNAFVYTKFEDALSEAKKLEEKIARHEELGPLSGVPVGLKDFLPSKKGWSNSHGGVRSLIRTDNADSNFYEAASEAGAIAVGKTNAPAFGFRGTCDNKLYGPTSNPFNTDHNSGGSSGGSAAAVADGMLPLAEGSDGGGSIRIPSSWCSCFGFKGSVGSVPSVCRPDAWTATHPFCFNGSISRTVEDSALIMNYMARFNPRDPFSIPFGKRDFTDLMKKPVKDWKIAFTPDFDLFEVDKEIAGIVREAAYKFRQAGAHVDEVRFNFRHSQDDFARLWCRSISIDTSIDIELWKKEGFDLIGDHADELPEEFIYWNDIAFNSTVMDYRYFNELRTEILDEQQNVFDKYDLIISPVTTCAPVLNASDRNTKGPVILNGKPCDPLIGFCLTLLENFTGNPAASVPCGFTKNGLPVGMQIIGKKYRDEDVFAASHTFEQISPWNYEIPFNRITG
ncbi:MAG: amidase [Clostridiales bacterium]|nr:amidase [Clostridiales bacterium]